jgi:hypothetical protein
VEAFIRLLPTTLEVPGLPWVNVRALEVPPEDPDQVFLVVDLCRRKVLEPSSGRVGKKEGEVPNDEVVIVHRPELTGEPIVSKTELRLHLLRVLGDSS